MTEKRNDIDINTLSVAPVTAPDSPSTARYATSDEFFSLAGKIITEEVYVPAIDRTVLVKALTPGQVQQARLNCVERRNGQSYPRTDREFTAMIVYYATVNPDGSQYFRQNQIEMLNTATSNAAVQSIYKVAAKLTGLDEDAEEQARKKHFEGARKDA